MDSPMPIRRRENCRSLLAGKKGWIINTQGEAEEIYRKNGMSRSIDQAAEEGIFDFTGISTPGTSLLRIRAGCR